MSSGSQDFFLSVHDIDLEDEAQLSEFDDLDVFSTAEEKASQTWNVDAELKPESSNLSCCFLLDENGVVSNEDGQIISFDSDDSEDLSSDLDDSDPVPDTQARVLEGLEKIVLAFMMQIDADGIELSLVNRTKLSKGSPSHRVLKWPTRTKKGNFKSFARLIRAIDLIHEAVTMGVPTTKRDIFYKDVSLFKTQSVVDALVDDIAATLQVSRADLNVRASAKGLFCGSGLRINLLRGGIVQGHDSEGTLIPSRADISHMQIKEEVSWVLVVEKEAVFQTLCNLGLCASPHCPGPGIIITGKGYPDLSTRELVNYLSTTLPTSVPLLVLVDADSYGLDILSVYKFGSQNLSHERNVNAPRAVWLGVWTSELSSLGIDRDRLLPLTKCDHKKALAMLKRDHARMPVQWRKELSRMLHARRKAEIEIISTVRVSLLPSSQSPDMRALEAEPPLVQYLVSKLVTYVGT